MLFQTLKICQVLYNIILVLCYKNVKISYIKLQNNENKVY